MHSAPVQENKNAQTQNNAVHYQGGNATFLPFADNRPEAIQLRRFQAMARQHLGPKIAPETFSKQPVQRLVIAVGDPKKMDITIAIELAFHKKHVGGEVISLDELKTAESGTIAIKDGEVIVVVAHGLPGNIDGMEPTELVAYLTKIGNYQKAGGVFIASCDAATPTGPGKQDSVVDITNTWLNMDRDPRLPAVPVYGTAGLSLSDFSMLTGDLRSKYKKGFEGVANLIDALVFSRYPNQMANTKAGKDTVRGVYLYGELVLAERRYQQYDDHVIRALAGKLTKEEAIQLVQDLTEEIMKQANAFHLLKQKVEAARKETSATSVAASAHSGAAAPAAGAGVSAAPGAIPEKLATELAVIEKFIADAKGIIGFIQANYVSKKPTSVLAEANKGESTIEGFDAAGNPHATTYSTLVKKH